MQHQTSNFNSFAFTMNHEKIGKCMTVNHIFILFFSLSKCTFYSYTLEKHLNKNTGTCKNNSPNHYGGK